MRGTIINISRFCTDDGPGIRTTVFLKGCPLNCIWCHNPESQKNTPEIMYNAQKCINCQKCQYVCHQMCHTFGNGSHIFSPIKCTSCKKCADVCPSGALEIIGKEISVEEVFREIEKDLIFYQFSKGGVTLSGGEPLSQPDFSRELLKLCKNKGIHTAVETSGFAGEGALKMVLKYCDLVLFDIKETDEQNHKNFTGVSLKPILKNLYTVNDMNIPFIIRMPVIPGLNDREEHFSNIVKIARQMKNCEGIEVMPYHKLGEHKYELLQRKYLCSQIDEPSDEMVKRWRCYTSV